MIVSSGVGSAESTYLRAAASGQPAHNECSSRISLVSGSSLILRGLT